LIPLCCVSFICFVHINIWLRTPSKCALVNVQDLKNFINMNLYTFVLIIAAGTASAADSNINTLSNLTMGGCDYSETCTVGGIEGSCTSISSGCCSGTATAGYCSGGNDNQAS